MKKQFAVATSFCALLTLSAFAPTFFWQDNHNNAGRFPANEVIISTTEISENKVEAPEVIITVVDITDTKTEEVKEEKVKEVKKIEAPEVIITVVEVTGTKAEEVKTTEKEVAQVTCLQDKQPTALEEEIKKLMADKESILKEIEDLKASKVASQKVDKIEKVEKTEKIKKSSDKESDINLISRMTSMMISQQEQQQMLTQQMFTMMNQMMQMQMNSSRQSSQNFTGPMNFEAPQIGMTNFYPHSSNFENYGQGVGIGYPSQTMFSYKNPYSINSRAPSAQNELGYSQRAVNVQPQFQSQFQSQYPIENANFSFTSSDYSSEMQRMQF